ncbi:MAG: ABC transporter permease [Hyphomicrobiales bacterium]
MKYSNINPLRKRLFLLLLLWLIAVLASSLVSPYFLKSSTLPFLLQYVPILGVLGMGQTLVMLGGGPGIDLSVGSMLSLTGLAIAGMSSLGLDIYLACLLGVVFGGMLGTVNATLINIIGIPSLMATLATMFVFGGLAVAMTGGTPIGGIPDSFAWLGQEQSLLIPNHFLILFVPIAIILHILLTQTVIGSHIYAAGDNERAAYLVGVKVKRLRFGLYVLSGVLSAIGAVMMVSWFQAARPDAGRGMELLSVTIAVLGGTHIFGGIGRISGTIVAIMIVTTMQVGLQLANISQAWQLAVIGGLLIGSMVIDNLSFFAQRGST